MLCFDLPLTLKVMLFHKHTLNCGDSVHCDTELNQLNQKPHYKLREQSIACHFTVSLL